MPYQIYTRAVPSALTGPMLKVACNPPEHNRGLIEGEGMDMLLLNNAVKPPDVSQHPAIHDSCTNACIASNNSSSDQQ
jgi:hypothetical protein